MKKILVRCVLLVSLIQPLVVSALLPLVAGGLVMATNSTTLTTALFGSALVVGAAVGFVGLGSSTTPAAAPVLVHINASEPLPTPSGWTAPVSPSIEPKAPNLAHNSWGGTTWNIGAYSYGNAPQVCAQSSATPTRNGYDGLLYIRHPVATPTPTTGGYTWTYRTPCPTGGDYIFTAPVPTCPSGYTSSGGVCVATPGAVDKPSDSKCTIIRTGNTFAADPKDPDCSVGVGTDVTISGTEIEARPTNQKQKVKINGDGSVTTTTTTINTSNNTTTTTTINVSGTGVGNAKITGIGTTTVPGTGDQAGSTPIPSPGEDGKATEATLAAAKGKLDEIKAGQCGGSGQPACKIDETGTPTDATLSAQKSDFDKAGDARKGAIEGTGTSPVTSLGFGLSIPWPSPGGCSNPSFSIPHMGTLSPDFCAKHADVQAAMNWIVIVGAMISIFLIGIGAFRGGK